MPKTKGKNSEHIRRIKKISLLFKKTVSTLMMDSPKEVLRIFEKGDEVPSIYSIGSLSTGIFSSKGQTKSTFIKSIIYLLNAIPHEYAMTIWKTYFIQCDTNWWKKYYSKSGYYRIRKKALEEIFEIADAEF